MSKLLIVSDPPVGKADTNVGGTHAVIGNLRGEIENLGHQVELVTGEIFGRVPPNQSAYSLVCEVLDGIEFDQVHLVTQGRLGLLAREYLVTRGLAFSAGYHTQIPEYLEIRHGFPREMGYGYMRHFLNGASSVIVPTPEMVKRLSSNGINNVVPCMHGVNTTRFHPGRSGFLGHLPRPLWLFVGRVTPEKNPEAFLSLDLPGTKVVVGDGPLKAPLQAKYPDVFFAGVQMGDQLAETFRECDCFVFPSLTDTFGLVILEAMASGLPVAAFPVTGPVDVVTDPRTGCLHEDLQKAALTALTLSPADCRAFAIDNSWTKAAQRFLSHQVPAGPRRGIVAPGNHQLDYLENLVFSTELLLFADEPEGPFSKKTQ